MQYLLKEFLTTPPLFTLPFEKEVKQAYLCVGEISSYLRSVQREVKCKWGNRFKVQLQQSLLTSEECALWEDGIQWSHKKAGSQKSKLGSAIQNLIGKRKTKQRKRKKKQTKETIIGGLPIPVAQVWLISVAQINVSDCCCLIPLRILITIKSLCSPHNNLVQT